MKNKYYKPIVILLFVILCAVMFVAVRYVNVTASTFKFSNFDKKAELTMKLESSYGELKATLKQKYAKLLANSIEETRLEFDNSLKEILGEEYLIKRKELSQLETQIKKERNEFLKSDEYLNGKQKLKDLKQKIDETSNENEKEELQSEFNVTLNELSTLNVKFNNVLKSKREEIDSLKSELKQLFSNKKDEISAVKDRLEQKTKKNIGEIISQFNFELKELNEAFAVSLDKREMPYDDEFLGDISVVSKFENDCINENTVQDASVKLELISVDGVDDVVVLENTSKLKS
ncbi:MAG: hypothetical protein IKV61_05600 [Clostridia bacterium]|nr:hypothetical protein [Clostridia bacterium]